MRGSTVRRAVALLILGSCASTLPPGQIGTLRYAGRVKGAAPLNLLPPVTDPSGNVYVLNGAPAVPETHAFVGFAGGGWSANCDLTKGDAVGAHGWSGFATNRQWYWSGGALVAVSGQDGSCHRVLDKDRSTNADLFFQAVMPAVRNLSERTTLAALVQSPTDPSPFSALVDLNAEFLTNVQAFEPSDAHDVSVIGVGGDRNREQGFVLVQYKQGDATQLELRYYDGDAIFTNRVAVASDPLPAYAVQGYLQIDASGLVAGLIASGDTDPKYSLLTIDASGGDLVPIDGMDPVGVHLWKGELWLVGVAGSTPAVAPIARGRIGVVSTWGASQSAAGALGATTPVRDDRSLPSRMTEWSAVRTAMGPFPFLHAHSLVEHAPGTTLWLFAGPAVTGDALTLTSFAMAPAGVSYP
jgi:hypothetical protein